MTPDEFLFDVRRETDHAVQSHARFNSLHEAYAVILEEVDELWEEVRKKRENRNLARVRAELKQIAAMAVRAAMELT